MGSANSRTVDGGGQVAGSVHTPFPDLAAGGDVLTLLNRHQDVETQEVPVGTKVRMSNGDEFVYLQMTGGAAVLGMLTGQAAIVASDAVSSSADLLRIEDIDGTPLLAANDHVGDMAFIDDGLGQGQTRWIVAHGLEDATLDRVLLTALTVAGLSDLTVIRPYRAIINPLGAEGSQRIPRAVAIGAVADTNFGWFQCKGICQHVLITATTVAIGDNLTADVSAGTAGTAKTFSGTTSYDLIFGEALGAGAGLVANTDTIPVLLHGVGL